VNAALAIAGGSSSIHSSGKEFGHMQPLEHSPEAVGVGTEVVANSAHGLAIAVATGTAVSTLLPAGCEEVSLQAAFAFATDGVQTLAVNVLAQEEMGRAGAAYVEASGIYTTVDEAGASVLS
jgi:hypothetical protein